MRGTGKITSGNVSDRGSMRENRLWAEELADAMQGLILLVRSKVIADEKQGNFW